MKLPKQISPCPIHEAVVEIRFNSSLPSDAVFGVVYNQLKDIYPEVQQLPILQIPEVVRNADTNLIFQPHYKLKRGDFTLQVGPNILSLSIIENYTTWHDFLNEILMVFKKIGEIGFISTVNRVGLRYVNLFKEDIWDNINITVKIIEKEITDDEVFVRTVIPREEFKVLLQVGNRLDMEKNKQHIGKVSVLDIDTSLEKENIDFFENIEKILGAGHEFEKQIFFGLLKEEFLNSLKPEY